MNGGDYLVIGVPGKQLDVATAKLIRAVQPAGFILFGRNIETPTQVRKLLDDLRSEVRREPILTIDQEGGRVSRLKECGAEPPSARQLRERRDPMLIARHGELTGRLLRLFGFNLNLAPVLDLSFDDEADNSLRNRTYGKNIEDVEHFAGAFTRAMRAQGILSCGKHFPGYTAATVDPHHELPVVDRTRAELEAAEWRPFRALLGELDSLMVGHAVYPAFDPSALPASLSPAIIRDLLRGEWNFPGVVICDDLDMGAIVDHYGVGEAVFRAVSAGNDLLLLCHRLSVVAEAAEALAALPKTRVQEVEARLEAWRRRLAPPIEFSDSAHAALDRDIYQLRVATLGEEAAAERSRDDGKRSPVESY